MSLAMLAGTLLFIGLGLEFDRYKNTMLSIGIITTFYVFLVMGGIFARRIKIGMRGFRETANILMKWQIIRKGLIAFFVVYSILPAIQFTMSGQSIGQIFSEKWATDTRSTTSQMLIELSRQSLSGVAAFINALQTQLIGFWYLGLGVALQAKSRLVFPVLVIYIFGTFLMGSSSRSLFMIAILLPIMIWILSPRRPRFRIIMATGLAGLVIILLMDYLVKGRQGVVAQGGIAQRIESTLRTDFAYGGLGLELGMDSRPESLKRGVDYLIRIAVQPIPRVLWPAKPATNPNQILTEEYFGRPFEEIGFILLFTPLGEALFYFGYFGIVLVPFLYGFTAIFLERLFSTSEVYKGLLISVYMWAFLGMRLTYFNLFTILVAGNFVLILLLGVASCLLRHKQNILFARPDDTYHKTF